MSMMTTVEKVSVLHCLKEGICYSIACIHVLYICYRTIWRYLEHLAGLLQSIATVLCAIPSEEKPYVKSQLIKSNRQRNSFSSQSPKFPGSRLPRSISTGIPNVTSQYNYYNG